MVKKIFALFLFSGVFLYSCGSGGSQNEIKIDGSGTVYPITEAVAEEFRKVEPNIRVSIGSSGSGAGFKKFVRGETEISNSSREISEEEKALAEENGIEYQQFSIALDGISIVAHPDNDWIKTLTPEELNEIWKADSEVQQWSDIREGWPDEDIRLYGPNTAHGTYDFFTETINGESGASRTDYNAVADYNVAVQGISSDKYSLGYFGLAYYEENADQLKLIGIDSGDGPVEPSLETVKDGTYKPLSRSLYIYVAKSAAKRPAVQKFVEFYFDNAGELAKDVGYVPMPEEDIEEQKSAFRSFASDTVAAN
ncbi:PstS family phosphate ABC transporter substrate-binding protein [Fodinibius sp. AD559]|uniref:PstS family phosphate ABC transporter substrate-binding protein n=1 Tax=Fodinibius sp. AD559 TaxID=3424179 RepID=UPI004046D0A2